MSSDEEIMNYIRSLLEHQSQCKSEGCRSCLMLHGICELIKSRIFFDPLYPKAMASASSASGSRVS